MKYLSRRLSLLASFFLLSCSESDTNSIKPGKNYAGNIAGVYNLNKILDTAVSGTGSVTLTAVNDTTATIRNRTSLKMILTGKTIPLTDDISKGEVSLNHEVYTISYAASPFSANKYLFGNILLGNRLVISPRIDGKEVSIEFIKAH